MDPRDSGVMTFRRGAEQLYQAWWRIDGERFTGHERSTRAQAEDDLDVIRQVIESEQLEEATEAVKVVAKNKTDTELRDLLKEIAKMNKRDAEKFGTTETGVLLEDIEKGFREAKVMPIKRLVQEHKDRKLREEIDRINKRLDVTSSGSTVAETPNEKLQRQFTELQKRLAEVFDK